ncbi:hypothetical protein F4778DRAFT_718129 [Xylariomycetidae sp. FL2044]|nr:hypothetical protein F4778DRAFT_718129 [Xylariomycetidae sp. FL2044]
MDPSSIPFPSPQDPLSHDIHHQHPHQSQPQNPFRIPSLPTHSTLDLGPLDTTGSHIFQHHLQPSIPAIRTDFSPHATEPFDRGPASAHLPHHAHHHQQISNIQPPPQLHHAPPPPPPPPRPPPLPGPPHSAPPTHSQFGLLTQNSMAQPDVIPRIPPDGDVFPASSSQVLSSSSSSIPESAEQRPHGQLVNKIVVDPPDLRAWREKLFHVDDTIILTNEQFETYFPHIDNVYSHRSTQKYKRKPFVSHYWDCRMKGRPPGTPKSDDPTKKKRKRNARERDLCDVKIKITEYFPGATIPHDGDGLPPNISSQSGGTAFQSPQQQTFPDGVPRALVAPIPGEKYWTIQRVNGNGGNGKGDGVAGPHKHTLAKSDEIKKSTVQRYLAAQEKGAKKTQQKPVQQQQQQQKRPSGAALATAKKHSKDHNLKLYAASFCPFSQRVWIALEAKGMQYQYSETDPFKRPTHLLEANPRGMVPAIRQGDWACGESSIILEYLEDHDQRVPLFPTDPRLKANCRLWIDHINAKIVPAFYALVRTSDFAKQSECMDRLRADIAALVQAADEQGPYFLGTDLCLVDIHLAPFVLRMSRILRERCGWHDPPPNTRWHHWVDALEQNPHIQATTSTNELYVETFELFLRRGGSSSGGSGSSGGGGGGSVEQQ